MGGFVDKKEEDTKYDQETEFKIWNADLDENRRGTDANENLF